MLRLTITTPRGVQRFDLDPRRTEWVVGRSRDADIVVDDELTSKRHFRIERVGQTRLRVVDLGSRNGVRLDGQLSKRIQIAPGDRITFGKASAELVRSDESASAPPKETQSSSPARARAITIVLVVSIGLIAGVFGLRALGDRSGEVDGAPAVTESEVPAPARETPAPAAEVWSADVRVAERATETSARGLPRTGGAPTPDESKSAEVALPDSGDAFDAAAFAGCSASLCHATTDVDFRGTPATQPGRWRRNAERLALRANENGLPAFRATPPHDEQVAIDLAHVRPASPGPFSRAVPPRLPNTDTLRARFVAFQQVWRRAPSATEIATPEIAERAEDARPVGVSPRVAKWRSLWTVTFGLAPSTADLQLLSELDQIAEEQPRVARQVVRVIAHSPFRVAPKAGRAAPWTEYVARTAGLLDWNGPGVRGVAELIDDGSVDPAWTIEALFTPTGVEALPSKPATRLAPDGGRPVRIDIVSRHDFRRDFREGESLGPMWTLLGECHTTVFEGLQIERDAGDALLERLSRPVESETRWVDRARASMWSLFEASRVLSTRIGAGIGSTGSKVSPQLRPLLDRVGDPVMSSLSSGNRKWLLEQIGRSEVELEPPIARGPAGATDVVTQLERAIDDANGALGAILVLPDGPNARANLMARLVPLLANRGRAFDFWFWSAADSGGRTAIRVQRPAAGGPESATGWVERVEERDPLDFHPTTYGRRTEDRAAENTTGIGESEREEEPR